MQGVHALAQPTWHSLSCQAPKRSLSWLLFIHRVCWLIAVTGGMDTERPMGSNRSKAVKTQVKKTKEVHTKIALSVEWLQLMHVHIGSTTDFWSRLETMHQAWGFGTCLSLCCKFYANEMLGTMQFWITNVASAAFCLVATSISVTDEDQILILITRLPSSMLPFPLTWPHPVSSHSTMLLSTWSMSMNNKLPQSLPQNLPCWRAQVSPPLSYWARSCPMLGTQLPRSPAWQSLR